MSTQAHGLDLTGLDAALSAGDGRASSPAGLTARGVSVLTSAGAFFLLAGITALKALAGGTFLAVAGASSLPLATIVVSITVAIAGRCAARRGRKVPASVLLRSVMGISALALVLLGLRISSHAPGPAVAVLLLLTCALAGTLGVALAWTAFRSALPDTRRGLVLGGAFALLGGACGSEATILAAPRIGVGGMVLACAVLLLIGTACLDSCLMQRDNAPAPPELPAVPRGTAPATLMRSLGILAFLVVLCSTLAELQFACAAASMRQGPEALAGFISSWQLVVSLAAIPVHLILSPLLRRDRLAGALLVAPIVMLAAGAVMVVMPGVAAALALKATDGTLRHSFHKGVLEGCLLPLPEPARVEARLVTDTLVDRGAQAVASGLAWGLMHGLGLGARGLAVLTAAAALAWLVAALRLGPLVVGQAPRP